MRPSSGFVKLIYENAVRDTRTIPDNSGKIKEWVRAKHADMPKPKKGEIYGTYNNEMCYERGLENLKKIKGIEINPLDRHTIKIVLKKQSSEVEALVNEAIRSSKGYVEIELETINALKVHKKKSDSGVLDTPFYG